jgi:phage baseplate assembly protein W
LLFTKSIKYPVTFNLVSGATELDDKITSINRCIGLLLTTAKGELLGDPDFGCRLYEILFDQYSNTLVDIAKQDIVDNISLFESRVIVTDKDIEILEHKDGIRNSYNIKITYTIKNSNQISNTEILLEERVKNG